LEDQRQVPSPWPAAQNAAQAVSGGGGAIAPIAPRESAPGCGVCCILDVLYQIIDVRFKTYLL